MGNRFYKTLKYKNTKYYAYVHISIEHNEPIVYIKIYTDGKMKNLLTQGTFAGNGIKERVENALFGALKYKILSEKAQKSVKEFIEWDGNVVENDRVIKIE